MAIAFLRGIDDELVSIQLPASRVYLLVENYHMTKTLPNIEFRHKIDRVFVIFSAIKRAIGMAKDTRKNVAAKIAVRCNTQNQ